MTNEFIISKSLLIAKKIDHRNYCFISYGQGYRNLTITLRDKTSNEYVNLIIFNSDLKIDLIKSIDQITILLNKFNLNVRRPLKSNYLIKIKSRNSFRLAGLYTYIEGETIPWESFNKKLIKNTGFTMGKMHKVLKNHKVSPNLKLPPLIKRIKNQIDEMKFYFSDKHIQNALREKLNLNVRIPSNMYTLLQRIFLKYDSIPVHMDFVRGNIILKNKRINGIIDFEKMALAPELFDIARTIAFLNIDTKYTEEKIEQKFIEGYLKGFGHINGSKEALNLLIHFFTLYDFYKFLKHNPYEDLHKNRHFSKVKEKTMINGYILRESPSLVYNLLMPKEVKQTNSYYSNDDEEFSISDLHFGDDDDIEVLDLSETPDNKAESN